MAKPTDQYLPWDLFLQQQHLAPLQIGRWKFGCNPWEFHAPEERAVTQVQTRGGPLRVSFNNKAIAYSISGFCGNAGVDELRGMQAFRPQFSDDVAYPLTFPMFGIYKATIYIDYFEPFVDQEYSHYIKYQLRGSGFPPPQSPYTAQSTYTPSGIRGALIAP